MRIALKLLDKRDQAIDDIRQKIKHGLEDTDAGRVSDGEEFMAQMLAELDEEIRLKDEKAARELATA